LKVSTITYIDGDFTGYIIVAQAYELNGCKVVAEIVRKTSNQPVDAESNKSKR